MNKEIQDTLKEITSIRETLDQLQTIKSLQESMSAIPNTVTTYNQTIKSLQESMSAIPNTVTTYNQTIKSLQESMSTIPNTVTAYNQTIKSLQESMSTIPNTVTAYNQTIKSLQESMSTIPNIATMYNQTIQNLQESIRFASTFNWSDIGPFPDEILNKLIYSNSNQRDCIQHAVEASDISITEEEEQSIREFYLTLIIKLKEIRKVLDSDTYNKLKKMIVKTILCLKFFFPNLIPTDFSSLVLKFDEILDINIDESEREDINIDESEREDINIDESEKNTKL